MCSAEETLEAKLTPLSTVFSPPYTFEAGEPWIEDDQLLSMHEESRETPWANKSLCKLAQLHRTSRLEKDGG